MSSKKYVADIIQVNNDSNGIKFVKEDGTTILFNIDTENQTIQGVSSLYNPININGDEVVYVGQDGKFYIQTDIIVSGETYIVHAEEIKTTKDLIITRSEADNAILSGDISGIQVTKYNGTDNLIFGTDSDGYFKVGKIGSLQILSTRQDSPINNGLTYWNNTDKRFDTHSNLIYNPTTSTLTVTNINATLSGTSTSVSQSLTAGNGLTSTGTYNGSTARTFSVQSQSGTAGTTGTVSVTSNGVGVNLGTTSITAFRGDYGNAAYTHAGTTTGSVHGSTTVGINLFRLTDPSAIRFIRINANNTVDTLSDSDFRTSIGASLSTHTHGDISNTGTITSTVVTAANTDHILISDTSDSGKIVRSISIGTSTTTYLRNNGTWATPSAGVTSVAAGNGMNFTTITGTGSVIMGTPSSCSPSTSNAVTSTSHTHTITGVLSNSTSSTQDGYFGNIYLRDDTNPSHYMIITCANDLITNATLSINPNNGSRIISLKGNLTVNDTANVSGTNSGNQTITNGNGMNFTSGSGNVTITLGTPSSITTSSTNSVTTSSHTHAFAPGGTTSQYIRGDGNLATFPSIPQGTVTSVGNGNGMNFTSFTTSGTITLGTPSSVTLSSTNSVATSSHTHAFAPGGTTSQYIRGDGTLATTPVNTNYYLTGVSGSGNGTVTFTVNGATNPTWDASHTHSYLSNSTSSTQTGSFGELYSRTRLRLYNSTYYFAFDTISSTDLRLRYNSTSSSVFRFLSNGTFDAASNIIGYSTSVSDSRLKENVNNLKSSLDKVLKLRGINFEWKGENKDGTHVGYIAQEVEEIIPEVVIENDLMKFGGVYKTIRYEEIIPYLSEAIKEQQNTINELKEEIYNLKNK